MKTQKKVNLIMAIILTLGLGAICLNFFKKKRDLAAHGVYVLGKKVKYKSGGNRMGTSYYSYFFRGKNYLFGIRDGGQNDSVLFFHVLPADPSVCIKVDNRVPYCIEMRDVPTDGWKELPLKACL